MSTMNALNRNDETQILFFCFYMHTKLPKLAVATKPKSMFKTANGNKKRRK